MTDSGDPPPTDALPSAEPPTVARILAFGSILLAGLCGGLIGYAVTDLQCTDGCSSTATGVGALVGAVLAAGVAVVAVLVLRAMAEWRVIEHTGDPSAARRAQKERRL